VSIVERVFQLSPYFEVVARRIYWSSPWLVRLASSRGKRRESGNVGTGGTL
jgi:hypothetical protein